VLPTLASNRLSVGADIKYQDFPAIDYFGVGPDTSADARTDYRLRSLDASASALVRIRDRLAVGGRVGYMRSLSVESGRSSLTPSIEDRFDETDAPGLVAQPRFQHADVFVEADSRDVPGYPTSGGFYRAGFSAFRDVTRSGHDFRRVDLDAVHYLPLFHRGSVVAVRGRLVASQTSAGQDVPFYLMPTLGSENTLRGYADYRFRDRNAALVSLEYQWPVFRVMDAALFADGGTVAAVTSDLWRTPKTDYGVGIRFHSPARTFLRVDVAKSPEGTRLIVSVRAPLRTTRRDVAPYVP
jgi:outer membrane protein assembly factor BamA